MQSTPKRVLFFVYGCSLCGAWGAEGEFGAVCFVMCYTLATLARRAVTQVLA